MGVVYRAYHHSSNRIVALKMILSGVFATPEATQRFSAETKAIASLDHPGIAPLFDQRLDGNSRHETLPPEQMMSSAPDSSIRSRMRWGGSLLQNTLVA